MTNTNVGDAISRQAAIKLAIDLDYESRGILKESKCREIENRYNMIPSVQSRIIRCKDCKHRPTGETRYDLEFPDDICPCQCEDYWYSWKPADDWYCGNGERDE